MKAAGDDRLLPPRDAVRHQDRFAGRGRAVVHGGVGDLHPGQVRHLRLELEEILQRALRDLRLVGRVGGEELRALDDVVDGGRHVVAIGARADEERPVAGGAVLRRERAHDARHFKLGASLRQIERLLQPLRRRYVGEEVVDFADADLRQHVGAVLGRVGQVAHRVRRASAWRRRSSRRFSMSTRIQPGLAGLARRPVSSNPKAR